MKEQDILIGKNIIGYASKVFVIAEVGINHNGSVSQAFKLIDAASECGADAVKFQSFRADHLLIPSQDRYSQQKDADESAYEALRRLELSWEDQEKLKRHADARGITFLSTPFDCQTVDFLDSLGVPAFKIASSDITHVPLLRHIASKGKPILLSTGMSYLSEIADALWDIKSAGAKEIVLLHCVSAYPAATQYLNLRALQTLNSHFELPVGFSDHSEGIFLSLVAVALGAVVIEKHFTLDRQASGPDHKASIDPNELKQLVSSLRDVEASLGDGRKRPTVQEEENRILSRRSIVAALDISAHDAIADWMLAFKRPGSGIEPRYATKVIGMKARRNIAKDTIIQWEDLVSCSASNPASKEPEAIQDPFSSAQKPCVSKDLCVK